MMMMRLELSQKTVRHLAVLNVFTALTSPAALSAAWNCLNKNWKGAGYEF